MKGLCGDRQAEIGNQEKTNTSNQEKTAYCLKLNNGGYIIIGHNNDIMEVHSKHYADTFDSIKEAEKICREYWIEAKVEIWQPQEDDDED